MPASTKMKMKDIILCILWMLLSLLPVVEAKALIASVLALEGDAVEIVCPTIERYESYFWRKGDSIEDSTGVASIVDGVPITDSKNYAVTANGTLCIQNVTLKDKGNYFCRGVSLETSCTTNIMVYVQVPITTEKPAPEPERENTKALTIFISCTICLGCIVSILLLWQCKKRSLQNRYTSVPINEHLYTMS